MKIQSVPVNVITGFLGSGKTSFIQRLLAAKPANERWAVLINEFGEIGLDAALLGRQTDKRVIVGEVAGGCMCCAAGVSTQVAVTQILSRAKPDRLLIEPTGLGHPDQILKLLRSEFLVNVLALKSTLCLVDASRLKDARYTEHEIFRRQLAVADLVLASKADSYGSQQIQELGALLESWSLGGTHIHAISEQWPLDAVVDEALQLPAKMPAAKKSQVPGGASSLATEPLLNAPPLSNVAGSHSGSWLFAPEADNAPPKQPMFDGSGIIEKTNVGDGFYSLGWIYSVEHCFDFDRLVQLFQSVTLARLKAVMITLDGIAAFNLVDSRLRISELDDALDSRIELISEQPLDSQTWRQRLLACLADH
ncbi:MAG: GTP-binding protein [Shewanella sp.]|nr:GTP-binding protein [Shewanella sp.]MCF1432025.1 GTP-binding protein [Shewanella sp.]MCF1440072.1 GTP-binding protein [Shewanella sp.]MCF1457462.1 GTP-binding protein [Shewanella sp.]